jgi:hypothetical protein
LFDFRNSLFFHKEQYMTKAPTNHRSLAEIQKDLDEASSTTSRDRLFGTPPEKLTRHMRLLSEKAAAQKHLAEEQAKEAAAANTQAAAKRAKREARVLDQLSFSPDLQEQVRALLATK